METEVLLEGILILVGIGVVTCLLIWLTRKLKTSMACAEEGQSLVRESLELNREFKPLMEKQIELQQESNRLTEELIVALKQRR